MTNKNHTKAYFYLFLTAVIWGFAGPVIKFTLQFFPPSIFLTYRFAFSAIIAVFMLLFYPPKKVLKLQYLPKILLYGVLVSTVALGLLFIAFDKTSSLTGSIIGAIAPIFITAAGALYFHESVTHEEKLGSFFALVGSVFIIIEPLLGSKIPGQQLSFAGNMYHAAALIVSIATAILAKMVMKDYDDALAVTNIAFIIGFVTMVPIMLANHTIQETYLLLSNTPVVGHLGVLYMALFSGTIAYTLWHIGQDEIGIGETSLFSYLMPVFAAPLSFFWLHEPITPVFLISTMVIASGVAIAEYRKTKTVHRKTRSHRRKR